MTYAMIWLGARPPSICVRAYCTSAWTSVSTDGKYSLAVAPPRIRT